MVTVGVVNVFVGVLIEVGGGVDWFWGRVKMFFIIVVVISFVVVVVLEVFKYY